MFEKFKNYFKGKAPKTENGYNFSTVGVGKTFQVDAHGDIVYASCIEILAKEMAQIHWGLYDKHNEEVENAMAMYQSVMNLQPYPGINAYDFWEYMEKQRLTTGNAIAYIKPNEMGFVAPACLVPLDSTCFNIYWDNANILDAKRKIIYEYRDPVSQQTFYMLPDELIHLKAFSANGIVGRPALKVLGQTLRSKATAKSNVEGSVDAGFSGTIILTYTSDLKTSQQQALQKKVQENLRNSNRAILPLPVGMTAQNINNDIKSQAESLIGIDNQEISAFFGIPLAMLNLSGGYGNASFNESQMAQFYTQTVLPIVRKYASELSLKLLTAKQQNKGYRFDSDADAFDSLDAKSKSSVLVAYKANGIITANEARASLKYVPSTDESADKLIGVNTGGSTVGQHIGGDEGGRGNNEED